MSKKVLTPFIATHPGEMIKDELKERGMTQKQLAQRGCSLGESTWHPC